MTSLLCDLPEIPGYKVESPLGAGGMATVYRARQIALDRLVAIKVLRSLGRDMEELNQRFEQEAKMIAALDHPSIVAIYEVTRTTDGDACYVMPLLDYGDLGTWIKPTPEPEIKRVIGAVLDALGFAHRLGIVHRDVKAENVLFDVRGTPQLADFGVAMKLEKLDRLTGLGRTVGSSQTMSPEQARGEVVDGRSDLYSVGCLVFELLVGEHAFPGTDFLSVALMHQQDPVPRLPPHCAHWQPFIDRALAKKPEHRFADAASMKEALLAVTRGALGGSALRADAPLGGSALRAGASLLSLRKPLLLAAALFVFLILAWLLLRPGAPEISEQSLQIPPIAAAPATPQLVADPFAKAVAALAEMRMFDGSPGSADALLAPVFASEPIDSRAIDLRDELLARFEPRLIAADDAELAVLLPRWREFVQASRAVQTPTVRDAVAGFEKRFEPALSKARSSQDRSRAGATLALAQALPQPSLTFDRLVKEVAALPQSGEPFRDSNGPELVLVPAGKLQGFARPFAVTRGEITRADYARFAKATGRAQAGCRDGGRARSWSDPGFVQQPSEPVVCVSYADAGAYASWLSRQTGKRYRLPNLNEWRALEKASLAGSCANLRGDNAACADRAEHTTAIASFPTAPGMPADLVGNVREWTSSCEYRDVKTERGALSRFGRWVTRKGPDPVTRKCAGRYVAGSGWRDTNAAARVASASESHAAVDTGFRLIREM